MRPTLAFDVYGTLIDPMGIVDALSALIGDDAQAVATDWRQKQVEYLFRRGLGRKYQPFSVCTRQALEFTRKNSALAISDVECELLMAKYLELPAYPGAVKALGELADAGFRNFAFSNGEADDLAVLLSAAGFDGVLDGIVSVHEVQSFKPDPAVYAFFLENTGALLGATWLVSGNPFDVIGSLEVGWKAAWVRRDPNLLFDPWGLEPTVIVSDLSELRGELV
jgi:2-haloacid dehalogenase